MSQKGVLGEDVEVLLATYNGEPYLQQQLDSILAQTYSNLRVLVRDDGSNDGTLELLHMAAEQSGGRVRVLPQTSGTGSPKMNFLRLMQASSAPYVALSDQDDIWFPDKVQRSMEALLLLEEQHGRGTPLLVFTDLTVVDSSLNKIHPSFWAHQHIEADRINTLSYLLAQNVVTGCTAVMNRALVERCLEMPSSVYMHDWWIALNACVFGHARALHTPTMLYRQHGKNSVGAVTHGKPKLIPSWRNHRERRKQWEMGERQAEALLAVHTTALPPDKRRILEACVRCETSRSRWVRVFTWLRYRFFQKGLRANLAILWYLWDMDAAKQHDAMPSPAESAQ